MESDSTFDDSTFDDSLFFRRATLAICGHLDLESSMAACLRVLASVMPADFMAMDLADGNTGSIQTIASATADGGLRLNRVTQIPLLSAEDLARWNSRDVFVVNRSAEEPVSRRMTEDLGIAGYSLILLFLNAGETRIGKLVLAAQGPDRYSAEHARRLALLGKPFSITLASCMRVREVQRLKDILADDNHYLRDEIARRHRHEIIGEDFGLAPVMNLVRQVAPRDSPVLLLGETGTGKDVIAQAIHDGSPRRKGPMIKVNCGAIPETLLDSELFGHEKGAFTGALERKRGRFERAQGGTIFLDEVGELPPAAQVRLLRVLQTKEIERVGGTHPVIIDARVIAATNRDLEAMVTAGTFRQDLWFRLDVFPIMMPPLRQRKSDIPALVRHFVDVKARRLKLETVPRTYGDDLEPLMAYDWPGNVRELENVVERALILSRDGRLCFECLGFGSPSSASSVGSNGQEAPEVPDPGPLRALDEVIAEHLRRVLAATEGKVHGADGAAKILGVNASTLRNRMNKLGISYGRSFSASLR